MSIKCPNKNDKEYLRLLDLTNGKSSLVDSAWIASNGNVNNIKTFDDLKNVIKEHLIKKTKELRENKNYIPNEKLVEKNPIFKFSYQERDEIKNSLLHLASINPITNTLLDVDDISKNLNETFFKSKLTALFNSPYYSKYKNNYETLLNDKVLREFILQVREDFKSLDNRIDLEDDENLSEDEKSTNDYIKDSVLINFKDKASASAKLLVRFIPEKSSGETLGLKSFSNFEKNWNVLQELFSNITERGEGKLSQMIERLDEIIPYKPHFYYLKKQLLELEKDGVESPKVTQFIRAFDKVKVNYTSSFIEENDNGYLNKISDSNQNSKERNLLNTWQNNFEQLYFNEDNSGNIIFNKNKAERALKIYDRLYSITSKLNKVEDNMLQNIVNTLNELGINIEEQTLTKLFYKPLSNKEIEDKSSEEIKDLEEKKALHNLKIFVLNLDKLFIGNKSTYKNTIKNLLDESNLANSDVIKKINTPINSNNNLLLPLAKEQSFFDEDLYGATIFGGGKMYQEYSLYTDIELKVQDLNLEENSKELKAINKDLYASNSIWKENLNEGFKIKLELFNARKLKGNDPSDTKELSPIDELSDRIDRVTIGKLPIPTLGDKNRIYYVSGMPIQEITEIDDYIIDIFTGYFFDELITMQKAWEDLYGDNPIPKEEQIEYYHTKDNVFQSTIFPSLNLGSPIIEELSAQGIDIYQKYDKAGKPFTIHPTMLVEDEVTGEITVKESLRESLRPYIKELLQDKINENVNKILPLVSGKSSLSTSTLKKLGEYNGNKLDINKTAENIATHFTINTLIANIEATKLFIGDPRMFKNIPDFLKRVPAISSTGDYLRVGKNVRPYYGIAVINSIITPSDIYTNSDSIKEIIEFVGDESSVAEVLNLTKDSNGNWTSTKNPYGKINKADAQAWITLDRFKEIISGLEGWNDGLEQSFNRIKNDTATEKDFSLFMGKNISMQPKKGMHFELKEYNGIRVPVYLKYSQAILFPQLTKNSPELARMLDLMEKFNVDELVTFDGIKSGAMGVVDINDTNLEKLNRIELSNSNWKLAQDLPNEGIKPKLVLSQPWKNIIADIDLNDNYFDNITGEDLVKEIHNVIGELSNIGLQSLRNEIYEDDKLSERKVLNKLIKELSSEGGYNELIKELKEGNSLDSNPIYRKLIQTKIANWYNKSSIKLKQWGGSAIQISDYGFNNIVTTREDGKITRIDSLNDSKNGIIWLKDVEDLLPPRIENGEFKAGQVLINYKILAEIIPNFKNIKHDKIKLNEAISPDVLKIITSRVPNQKLSFNDSLEIVGFLPPHIGDSIVAYKEIINKTGSDFDIDKMYFMIPNYTFEPKTKKIIKVKYLDDNNSTIDERYNFYLNRIKKTSEAKKIIEEAQLNIKDAFNLASFIENSEGLKDKLINILGLNSTENIVDEILIEDKIALSKEEFIKLPITKQNTKKALENKKLDLFTQILEHPKTFTRLISAVDNSWLKDSIDYMISDKDLFDLTLYDGIYQMDKRREFLGSKGGVGQVANHVSDHSYQWSEPFIKVNLGIGHQTNEGYLDLSQLYSKEFEELNTSTGEITSSNQLIYITEILSVYMNSFVDATKDNYIGKANFTSTTNNIAFMLIRGGVSPLFVNALIAQPILREYITRTSNNRGHTVDKTTMIQLVKDLLLELGVKGNLLVNDDYLKDLNTKKLMNNVIEFKSFEDLKVASEDIKIEQAKILTHFLEVLEPTSKALRDSVAASVQDREGVGQNMLDSIIRQSKINQVIDDGIIGNFDKKFNNKGTKTALGSFTDNSLEAFSFDFGNVFIENTKGFRLMLDKIYKEIYGKLPDNIKKVSKISNMIYGTLLATNSNLNLNKEEKTDLFFGENSLANRLKSLKEDGLGITNQLINFLEYNINYTNKRPSFISINNTKILTPKVKEMLSNSWLELYYSNNKELVKFSKDLVKYSFHSSLFSTTLASFHNLIPSEISKDFKFGKDFRNELGKFLSSNDINNYNTIINNVMLNMLDEGGIAPKLSTKNVIKNIVISDELTIRSNEIIKIINPIENNKIFVKSDDMNNNYKPYIIIPKTIEYVTGNEIKSFKRNEYYKLDSIIMNDNIEYPIYIKTTKLGFKQGLNQMYEIDLSDNPSSIIPYNTVVLDKVNKNMLNKIRNINNVRFVESVENSDYIQLDKEFKESNESNLKSTIVKEGVEELFDSNPELAKIGTPQQYSQYLNTGKKDIDGFKKFVNQAKDVEELFNSKSYLERVKKYKEFGIKKSDGTEITEEDIKQNPTFYQNNTNQSTEKYIASEKTIRDLAARLSDRIGIPVRFESDRTKQYKGKLYSDEVVVNLAYATLDTPIHEILGHPIIRTILKSKPELYQNLLKELENSKGKEVLDRIKRDYVNKKEPFNPEWYKKNKASKSSSSGYRVDYNENTEELEYYFKNQSITEKEYINNTREQYTLEEQQEEAVVELLGLMTAKKLDAVEDGKLISLLKRLLKEMKQFIRSLINQKEVEIDKLPDNMTINDLADLLAYSNNKLILPGYEVEYTTPDNNKFKTYQEASNHISELAKNFKDIDLDNIKIKNKTVVGKIDPITGKKIKIAKFNKGSASYFSPDENQYEPQEPDTFDLVFEDNTTNTVYDEDLYNNQTKEVQTFYLQIISLNDTIEKFIEKNKEYEQSKDIIEEWKKVNDIQYNPEEIYSRGQEFSSVVGAYSDFDVNLMMQNLLSHIEDNEKAGGKFAISAYTKPIDKKIGHLEGGGGKIKFKLYPQSKDILWAANIDVYSGSVWDASEKVNKDKKSELLGVSYTKYPSLQSVNAVKPNLSDIVDNLAHHHNELGITLTGNNFRLEYDEDIPYTTKKVIDGINKILDQKYGKLVKPKINKQDNNKTQYEVIIEDQSDPEVPTIIKGVFESREEAEKLYDEINKTHPQFIIEDVLKIRERKSIGIQPTQTKNNTKSISMVMGTIDIGKTEGTPNFIDAEITKEEYENNIVNKTEDEFRGLSKDIEAFKEHAIFKGQQYRYFDKEGNIYFKNINDSITGFTYKKRILKKEKEFLSQALINTKIAALKEVAKKQPRNLIRSEVRPYKSTNQVQSLFDTDELPFQLVGNESLTPKQQLEQKLKKQQAVELYSQYLNTGKKDMEGFKEFVDNEDNNTIDETNLPDCI